VNQNPSRRSLPPTDISDEALLWLVKLHSGTAAPDIRRDFEAWRALSLEHEAAAQEAEALWAESSNLHQDPLSGIVKPGRRRRGPTRRAVIANTIGLAAAGSGLWSSGAFRGWISDHVTGLGETRIIALDDGSRVTLNARSAIDVGFTRTTRHIDLVEGEAFFEVVPDRARPFEVAARNATVTALGTAFDINSNIAAGRAAVAATRHAVSVTSADAPLHEPVVLGEGHVLVVDPRGGIGPIRSIDTSAVTAWRSGLYIAEDKPLEDVVKALQAYYSGWIVVHGRGIAALRVNAVLDLKTPRASLDALAGGLRVRVRHFSSYLTVISD